MQEFDANKYGLKEITDPSELAKYTQQQPSQEAVQGWLQKFLNAPSTQAVEGASDAIVNFPAQAINAVEDVGGVDPRYRLDMIKSGSGRAYDVGQIGGNLGSYLGGGEVIKAPLQTAAALTKGIPYIEKLAQALIGKGGKGFLSGAGAISGREAGNAAYGAIENPEDRAKGAEQGALYGLAGESLPLAAKGIARSAETMNPMKYTKDLLDGIKSSYESARDLASSYYEPVRKSFGNYHITKNNPLNHYINIDKGLVDRWYSPTLKDMYNDFSKKPTFDNAHDLQSEMGKRIGKIQGSFPISPEGMNELEVLSKHRNMIKEDIDSFLKVRNPVKAEMYKIGSDIFVNNVVPFRSNPVLSKISKGTKQSSNPEELRNALINAKEGGAIPQGHFLDKGLSGISSKIDTGKIAQSLTSILGGISVGEAAAPGVGGGALGLVAGNMLGPKLTGLAQNPKAIQSVEKLKPLHDLIAKLLISNKLQGGQNGY